MTFQEIKNIIQVAQATDIGKVMNASFDLFKKSWVQGLLFFLFLILILVAIEIVVLVPVMLFTAIPSSIDNEMIGMQPLGIILLFVFCYLILLAVMGTVMTGMTAGLYGIYRKVDHGEDYTTADFFTLLKGKYISKSFLLGISQVGLILLFYMMCCLPVIYVTIPVSYITVVYAFNRDLSVSQIIKLAFALGNKNWIEKFLLRIVMGFIAVFSGMLLCGIGMLATFALTLIPQYIIYKNTVGFDRESEINAIGSDEGFPAG